MHCCVNSGSKVLFIYAFFLYLLCGIELVIFTSAAGSILAWAFLLVDVRIPPSPNSHLLLALYGTVPTVTKLEPLGLF